MILSLQATERILKCLLFNYQTNASKTKRKGNLICEENYDKLILWLKLRRFAALFAIPDIWLKLNLITDLSHVLALCRQ